MLWYFNKEVLHYERNKLSKKNFEKQKNKLRNGMRNFNQ